MQKFIYTSFVLFFVLLLSSSFIDNKGKQEPKKQEPKKIEVKKQEVKKVEETKKILDTVKEKTVAKTEIKTDTIVEYKGKFKPYKKNAHASYYADRFHGKRTASGKIFNMNGLTAAHKKLPFGTRVKVINEANGKMVVVEVIDRGPFVKGREIDLSKKAFMAIAGNKNSGNAKVTLEVLQN
ncbi:septal ring lytic transglycosylase RlpA family protein [Flavobacterium sp.]|uniref:septal ring lytic transglycosylase RlpA family protein n=1 Tax=Flavobacterium sp. TaxID=239 RepID=UPI00345C2FC2